MKATRSGVAYLTFKTLWNMTLKMLKFVLGIKTTSSEVYYKTFKSIFAL